MVKLRSHDVDRDHSSAFEFNLSTWMPTIAMAMLCVFFGRMVFIKKQSVPAPSVQAMIPAATLPETAPEERVTDEKVQHMLWQVNGAPPSIPRPVATAHTNQHAIDLPAAETPQMVNVKGQWMPKSKDNTYRVKGETIYFEKGKRE